MTGGALGRDYEDGEVIVRQGDPADCMFVVQSGEVEVFVARSGRETLLRRLGKGEVIGEISLFDREVRSATVRARGRARLLTIDRDTFMSRVHEDPTLAFHIVKTLARRIRDLSEEIARLRAAE
jgi:CRP-like cAMP-binding protein